MEEGKRQNRFPPSDVPETFLHGTKTVKLIYQSSKPKGRLQKQNNQKLRILFEVRGAGGNTNRVNRRVLEIRMK